MVVSYLEKNFLVGPSSLVIALTALLMFDVMIITTIMEEVYLLHLGGYMLS